MRSPDDAVAATAELAAERRALASTLRTVGPDAPTFAGSWCARDLAAHLAATEQFRGLPTFLGRTLVARYGLRLNDAFRPVMALDLRRLRRHGFDWALERLERQSPALLSRPAVLPVSVFEMFVHHEDVRRRNDVPRQVPTPNLVPAIDWLLRYHRGPLRGFRIRVLLLDGHEMGGGGGDSTLTVRGSAEDVVLWLAGRREAASVALEHDGGGASALASRLVV